MKLQPKRVTLFCGHYGSGKSNLAVNYALALRRQDLPVTLADIDVVNPYFRSKDSEADLTAAGVEVIALPFANSNVDLPSLPSAVYGAVERRDRFAVLDVGGDDRGATALGRFSPYILRENDFEMVFVANFYRPLTRTAEEAMEVMGEISAVCAVPFTGIVNNSNIGEITTADNVKSTFGEAERLARIAGLPLLFTSVKADLAPALAGERVFPLTLQEKYW